MSIAIADSLRIVNGNSTINLHVTSEDNAYILDRLNLWVNDVPVYGIKGISIMGRQQKAIDTVLSITLNQGFCKNRK